MYGLQTVTFEIQHKPGYRLKIRAGFHSGAVVGGVVGTKIPHYSIFGDTVEIAGLMESAGLPMKVQALRQYFLAAPKVKLFELQFSIQRRQLER